MSDQTRNWMTTHLGDYVSWAGALFRRMMQIVPGLTVLVTGLSFTSQISMLLAFFLPLKTVLLLASPGVPSYFPAFLTQYDRDTLAIALGGLAALSYIVYVISDYFLGKLTETGADTLLRRAGKLALFADQESIATKAYSELASSIASMVFAAAGLVIIVLIYPALAVFLALFMTAGLVICVVCGWFHAMQDWFVVHSEAIAQTMSPVLFLSATAFVIGDLIVGQELSLIYALISILICRQLANRLSSSVRDGMRLWQRQAQLNALFFEEQVLRHPVKDRDVEFWVLQERSSRCRWLSQTLQVELEEADIVWRQSGRPGIAVFDVFVPDGDNLLVKLFSDAVRTDAIQEETLFSERAARSLPAPEFQDSLIIDGFHCHLFEGLPAVQGTSPGANVAAELTAISWGIEPPPGLVQRYVRSTPLLTEGLDSIHLSRMAIVAESAEHQNLVHQYGGRADDIAEQLRAVPLFVFNPDLAGEFLRYDQHGNVVAIHWGKWSLEPIGAGWPMNRLEELVDVVKDSDSSRVRSIPPEKVRLAALMFHLRRLSNRQAYYSAIELIPEILECLDAHPVAVSASS